MCGLQYFCPSVSVLVLSWYLANMCIYDWERRRMLKLIRKLSKSHRQISDKTARAVVDAVLDVFVDKCLRSEVVNDTYHEFADGVIKLAFDFPLLVPRMLISKLAGSKLSNCQRQRIAGVNEDCKIANALAYAASATVSDFAKLIHVCATNSKTFVSMLCAVIDGLSNKSFNVQDWNHLNAVIETYTLKSFQSSSESTPFLSVASEWSVVVDRSDAFENIVSIAVMHVFQILLSQVSPNTQSIDNIASLMSILVFMMTCCAGPCRPVVTVSENDKFGAVVNMLDIIEVLPDNNTYRSRFVTILNSNSKDLVNCRRVVDES